ncbi:hypothetical protein [Lacticaseibacillus jixiensis]|uniref:hypothetical protein n=1 Tax=Lacticaseibacillus jixiensis TaxID=3231926 RepID=UPI0036F3C035
MFKDVKDTVLHVVDTVNAPITSFDEMMRENPDLLLPLAVVHASLCIAGIAGTVAVIRGHQQVRIAKEQTKQVRMRAFAEFQGRHPHPPFGHGHGGHHHGGHQHAPRPISQMHAD